MTLGVCLVQFLTGSRRVKEEMRRLLDKYPDGYEGFGKPKAIKMGSIDVE